uniref:Uncharacterized protein n=1 Tax=Trichobilharzia regenti TaxID=157069 RepID=A0AA85IS85_TRIRE|nr:unnamed protein product [Trichobilharzia regenti]
MVSKRLISSAITVIYRLCALGSIFSSFVVAYIYLYPEQSVDVNKVLKLFRYLNFATLVVLSVYFLVATPLQALKLFTIHKYLYTSIFASTWTSAAVYWITFFTYRDVITGIEELKNLPLWYMQICSSFGALLILADLFVWRPQSSRLLISLIFAFIPLLSYNIFMEVSITVYSFSPYPQLDKISAGYRYLVYSIPWCLIGIFTLFCYGLLRLPPKCQVKTNCSTRTFSSSSLSASSTSSSSSTTTSTPSEASLSSTPSSRHSSVSVCATIVSQGNANEHQQNEESGEP